MVLYYHLDSMVSTSIVELHIPVYLHFQCSLFLPRDLNFLRGSFSFCLLHYLDVDMLMANALNFLFTVQCLCFIFSLEECVGVLHYRIMAVFYYLEDIIPLLFAFHYWFWKLAVSLKSCYFETNLLLKIFF